MIQLPDQNRLSSRVRKVLAALPGTEIEIADKVGFHSYSVRLWLSYFRDLGLVVGKDREINRLAPTEAIIDRVLQGEVAA